MPASNAGFNRRQPSLQTDVSRGDVTAIRLGRLIDGKGGVIQDAVVVVDGDRIKSVGHEVPGGASVIDLARYTALPGLIDVHTHMTYYWEHSGALIFHLQAAYLFSGVVPFEHFEQTF